MACGCNECETKSRTGNLGFVYTGPQPVEPTSWWWLWLLAAAGTGYLIWREFFDEAGKERRAKVKKIRAKYRAALARV